jgi:hypothetical protein
MDTIVIEMYNNHCISINFIWKIKSNCLVAICLLSIKIKYSSFVSKKKEITKFTIGFYTKRTPTHLGNYLFLDNSIYCIHVSSSFCPF